MAEFVRFGMHHAMNEQVGGGIVPGWDNWSQLGNAAGHREQGAGIPTKWKDTYHYAWGVQYQLDKGPSPPGYPTTPTW